MTFIDRTSYLQDICIVQAVLHKRDKNYYDIEDTHSGFRPIRISKVVDEIDLKIIRMLSMDCRISYRDIAPVLGISVNATKTRINKMIRGGIIRDFVVRVNPIILGYDMEYYLTVKNSTTKSIQEEYIIDRLSKLGMVRVYAKQLGGDSIVIIVSKTEIEDNNNFGEVIHSLKPAIIKSRGLKQRPLAMKVTISDFKIIKSLLSNARAKIVDIAKECSVSKRTVARRIEKMQEHHILNFTIRRDLSAAQLVGYIEFALIIDVNRSYHLQVLERLYHDFQEFLIFIPFAKHHEVIFAVFFCAKVATIDLILTNIKSMNGVESVEIFITTKIVSFDGWIKREIDNKLKTKDVRD